MALRKDLQKITEAYRVIQSNPEIAKNLGFNPDDLPCYETIRHFINDLLDEQAVEKIFYQLVKEIQRQLEKNGEQLGRKTVEDATVITAKRDDKEANYSGYYKVSGWKKDLLIDQDYKVFLGFQNLDINEDEAQALTLNLEKLNDASVNIDEITVDGKYPTYENIAIAKHQHGTDLFYQPQKDWVYHPQGFLEEINRRYQRYWKHDDFKVYANLEYKLGFLLKKGDVEQAGAYHRNQHVQRYNQRRKHCCRRYRNERNANEGFNSYLKQHLGFETSLPGKGRGQAFKHTTMVLIVVNTVALTRLQNGGS